MVYIVKDLDAVKEQMSHCRFTLYRVIEHPDKYEVRIKAGSIAWKGTFDKKDPKLEELKKLLDTYQAVEVASTMADEVFLT